MDARERIIRVLGRRCWMSLEDIAECTGLSRTHTHRVLKTLVEQGLVEVTETRGRGRPRKLYRLKRRCD